MQHKLISWSEAKERKLTQYYTGEPCVNGHVDVRFTSSATCKTCANIRKRAAKRKWYETATEDDRKERWQKEKIYPKKPMTQEQRDRAAQKAKEWSTANPHKATAAKALYKKKVKQATPSWLTDKHHNEIAEKYRARIILSEQSETPHEVDHIIPLRGKTVCGLHVPWNLAVIPAQVNRVKSNKLMES